MFGVRYDTSFAPQDPAAAHRDCGLDIEGDQQSPVATLRLRHTVPFGLHGSWADEYLGPPQA